MLTPQEIKSLFPLSDELNSFVETSRLKAKNIVDGNPMPLALICGPCSIHNTKSALDYARRLKELIPVVQEDFFIVMRVYFEKPRSAQGWKGFLYDPFLDGTHQLEEGVKQARQLMRAITECGVPIATELLDPNILPYFDDLITWGFIGSRTSSSQLHRQLASSCPFPVGFKNGPDGSLEPAVNSIKASREAHHYFGIDEKGKIAHLTSKGNHLTHLVLRGAHNGPNCDEKGIEQAQNELLHHKVNAPLLIDCSHGNSGKDYRLQPQNFLQSLSLARRPNSSIIGLMLESFIKEGKQPSGPFIDPETSITDCCMGWETTKELILQSLSALPTSAAAIH